MSSINSKIEGAAESLPGDITLFLENDNTIILRCGGTKCCPSVSSETGGLVIRDDYNGKVFIPSSHVQALLEAAKLLHK